MALTILLDIAKAFEHVCHKHLQRAAEAKEFCMYVLRWLLLTYSMERHIVVSGVAGPAVRAQRTIVPGSRLFIC